ncbi:U7 snRNA-associated Sm-like protein LSm11 [Musca vetustissima]|uniref:U7 snRNA-associated Sm-like protein LSm11 n=1 Tax=Musca vetustissima TaxID=27455 RepID=UPI002AB758FE|nr:U7 snRNA-associated Sm-like protein LSm11 [Musca vetustissima]
MFLVLSKIDSKEEGHVTSNETSKPIPEDKDKLQEKENERNTQPSTSMETQLDELDITSESFNPLRCLYANDFRVTEKQPKVIYQNMAAFETALKKVGIWDVGKRPKSHKQSESAATSKDSTKILVEEEKNQRRFQEHQMAIRTKAKIKSKHTRNILTQMHNAVGPLKALNEYISSGERVHVMVRKEKGIKGYVEGVLKLYDRHWNLLLTEVEECYTQRKHKFCEDNIVMPKEGSHEGDEEECSRRLREFGIKLPKQIIRSLNRKTVEIKRYLPQLLLRGEHVVLVHSVKEIEGKIL